MTKKARICFSAIFALNAIGWLSFLLLSGRIAFSEFAYGTLVFISTLIITTAYSKRNSGFGEVLVNCAVPVLLLVLTLNRRTIDSKVTRIFVFASVSVFIPIFRRIPRYRRVRAVNEVGCEVVQVVRRKKTLYDFLRPMKFFLVIGLVASLAIHIPGASFISDAFFAVSPIAVSVPNEMRRPERLTEEKWSGMTFDERLAALQEIENYEANSMGRASVTVIAKELPKNTCGDFSEYTNIIRINSLLITEGTALDNIDTILHEARHAYQAYIVYNMDWTPFVENCRYFSNIRAWRDNFEDYLRYDGKTFESHEAYRNQPIEMDAILYASGSSFMYYEFTND